MGENLSIFQCPGNFLLTEYIDYLLPLYPEASSVISLYQMQLQHIASLIYDAWVVLNSVAN